ncbi:MAG TPA: hypothetical protein VGQ06_03150 [Gemmatimonadales bacterium]|jgi:hypothetical protein|nr:hypothetical protein [Gemmatimonadales bacterium]
MRTGLPIVVCGMLFALACHRGPQALAPVLPISRVYYDDGPAFRDSVRMVVEDSMTWKQVWRQASSTQASPPPRPEVDFDSEILLVVGAGRMAPGDQIRVDSVGVRQGLFVVVVRTTTECRPLAADVYPLEIVRARRTGKRVAFAELRDRGANCQ